MDQARLETVLREGIAGFQRLVSCERLSAGASRETYRLEVELGGVRRPLCLRRATGGEERNVLGQGPGLAAEPLLFRAARGVGAPGPEVLLELKPEHGLGAGFVMEWIAGETLGARIVRSEALAATRPELARQCGEILARLHRVDLDASGLRGALREMAPVDCVQNTHEQYVAYGEPQPMIDWTMRWLMHNLPKPSAHTLVHSDFRNGNLIVAPEAGVVAVLDWELAQIGDPMRDLGWLLTRSWRFGGKGEVGGFGAREELIAGYEAASGVSVDRDAVRWWEVFGSYWWAVGCLSMAQSWRDGTERSVERPAIGRRSSECQIDCVNLTIPGAARKPFMAEAGAGLPTTMELLAGVKSFVEEAGGALGARGTFLGRVSGNVLDIVGRELLMRPEADRRERERLVALLGRDGEVGEMRRELCERLRSEGWTDERGMHTAPGIEDYLRESVLAQVMIDQPGYAGAVEAMSRAT